MAIFPLSSRTTFKGTPLFPLLFLLFSWWPPGSSFPDARTTKRRRAPRPPRSRHSRPRQRTRPSPSRAWATSRRPTRSRLNPGWTGTSCASISWTATTSRRANSSIPSTPRHTYINRKGAQANVASDRATAELAQKDYIRYKDLYEQQVISKDEYEQKVTAYETARQGHGGGTAPRRT